MTTTTEETGRSLDFIREIVEEDLRSGKHTTIVTRFPPEPNGYLHIGHAKSICLNFGIAAEFGGRCHLRFDDTNPLKEEQEYIDAIQADVRWLGFDWGEHLYYASDYFEQLYEIAERLVQRGKAYVDSQNEEEIRAGRGTVTTPGTPSPYRDRTPEEVGLALRALGVDYVYVDWQMIELYRGPGNYGFTAFVQPEVFGRLVAAGVLSGPRLLGVRQELYEVRD